ncbi:MAG: tyrosine-type recombinase/integrase [Cyanobacteria bacterium SZAS LIN-3]|nr:tyrosine-type recombinase/integrase [Cyanobacteria bacterium SZAS LIN-3]
MPEIRVVVKIQLLSACNAGLDDLIFMWFDVESFFRRLFSLFILPLWYRLQPAFSCALEDFDMVQNMPTLSEALNDFLRVRKPKESTQRLYRRILSYTVADWMDLPLGDISKGQILDRFREKSQTAPSQTNIAFRVLKSIFAFAIRFYEDEEGTPLFTKRNPVEILSVTCSWNDERRRVRRVQPAQMERFWAAVQQHQHPSERDLIILLMFTGLRFQEGARLRWEPVDWENRALTGIPLKQGRDHVVPLSDFLYTFLRRRYYRGDRRYCGKYIEKKPTDYIFPTRSGTAISQGANYYLEIGANCGVKFSFHDLRRGFISTALALGIQEITVKILVGHAYGQNMSHRYGVLNLDELRAPMEKVTAELLRQAGVREEARSA